jgi:hypothetical protein
MSLRPNIYFDRKSTADFISLFSEYDSKEFESPTRSTIPLISLVRDARDMFCSILADCDVPMASDLHFEFTVRPPIGRGTPSHTDLMVFSASNCLAIEAKWTEPPYESVAVWLSKKAKHDQEEKRNREEEKSNREKVLSGWIELLNCHGSSLAFEDVIDYEYQMLHRAASACYASNTTGKRPTLAYFKFFPSVGFASNGFRPATLDYYRDALELLWKRLGNPTEFPFFVVEIQITPTDKFGSIKELRKGNPSTGPRVRNALQEFQLFEFARCRVNRIGT